MFTHRPALKLGLPLIIGIIVGWTWKVSLYVAGPLLAVIMITYVISISFHRGGKGVRSILLLAMVLLLGIVKISYDDTFIPSNTIIHYARPEAIISLKCQVSDLPVVRQGSIRFVVEAESVIIYGQPHSAGGNVLVSMSRETFDHSLMDSITYGRTMTLSGMLTEPELMRNPGEFNYRQYLRLNGIHVRLYADRIERGAFGTTAQHTLLAKFVYPVRRSIGIRIESLFSGEEATFLKGLLIGERSDIPVEIKTAFINAGVMHILAVSGLHVAIVVLILLVLFEALRVPDLPRTLTVMILLVYYIFLTGTAASVVRSVVMAIIFLGAKLFEQKSDMYNTIACSAIIILLIDARQLFQPGFQLSFVAVLSLVFLYPRIYSILQILPSRLRERTPVSALVAALAVSLAAGIGTLPFTSYYFGKISVISFFANIVIVPLSNVILALGMLSIAISYCWLWPATVYAEVTSMLTWILLKGVVWFGGVSWAYIDSRFTLSSSVVFYAVIGLLSNIREAMCRRVLIIGVLVGANIFAYHQIFSGSSPGVLRLTVLDVGQGDGVFLELPNGKMFLIDAGPRTATTDAGRRFVQPFLQHRGVKKIDGIVISHPHSDHLGGIPSILKAFSVDTIYEAGSASGSALYAEYLHLVDSLKIHRKVLRGGKHIYCGDDVRLYVVHPAGRLSSQTAEYPNLNNESLVLKVVYGQSALLLPGDAELEAEQQMVDVYASFLRAGLLKAGHHGSGTSSTREFLNAIGPANVIISVGARNTFRHPSPEVIHRYEQMGVDVTRTDESGAVIFESDGKNWRRVEWR